MSATQFQSMLCAGKVSGTGERELKKHLRAHLGKGVWHTRRSIDMLADGHCDVHYGSMELTYGSKEKAKSSLSGPRKISMTELRFTYRGI